MNRSLSPEALSRVTRVVTHGNCPDGRASALIVHAALPRLPITEMAYGSPEHRALEPSPILFCDFSPFVPKKSNSPTPAELAARREVLLKWAAAGAVILDHHDPELVEPFGAQGIFGENAKGESGAVLAYQHLFLAIKRPVPRHMSLPQAWGWAEDLAVLSAIRDTWRRDSGRWNEACELSEALRFVPLDDLLKMGIPKVIEMASSFGPILMRKKREAAAEATKNAVRTEIGGHKVAIIPSTKLTSDVADMFPEADIIAGFDYVHEDGGEAIRLIVSLRSRADVNVRSIAERHGGGGHVQAAGFSLPIHTEMSSNPYRAIVAALES